jgi:hypothetical protein
VLFSGGDLEIKLDEVTFCREEMHIYKRISCSNQIHLKLHLCNYNLLYDLRDHIFHML